MTLMKALISKMETMDAELSAMRKSMDTPELLLKRAGFVRANTPANEDVWGEIHAMANEAAQAEGRRIDQ